MSDILPFEAHFVGAFAFLESPLLRGAFTAIRWVVPGNAGTLLNRVFLFSSKEEARAEALRRLHRRDVQTAL
jgi:hypothetical protein